MEEFAGALAGCVAGKTRGWVYTELEFVVDAVSAKSSELDKKWKALLNSGKLESALESNSGNNLINDLERDDLKVDSVETATCAPELIGYRILERQASLDLFDFYRGRPNARDEIKRDLGSYVVRDGSKIMNKGTSKDDIKTDDEGIERLSGEIIESNRKMENSEILTALADEISKSKKNIAAKPEG